MDTTVNCPVCGKSHNAPEAMIGTQVQCSGCGAVFTAIQAAGRPVGQPPPASPLTVPVTPYAPGMGAAVPLAPKTSGLAIASLILGATGFLTCGVTALVGLILGIVALSQINKSRGQLTGNGLAAAGIALSAVFMLMVPILAGMLLPALGRARDEARKVRCMMNLTQIAKATNLYLNKFGDNSMYPSSMRKVFDTDIIRDPKVFLCPAHDSDFTPGRFTTDYECILDMVGKEVSEADAPSSMPLAWDKKGNHSDGRCVVFFDSHAEFVVGDDFEHQWLPRITKWVEDIKAAKPPPPVR